MWTVPSVRVAANGLPRGLHVSASGAVWYPTERVSRWENHPLKIRHWYLWIILVPSEGMICSATSTWNRLKLRLHSSSCSTWALGRWLQKFSENLHDIRHKFHWHIDLFWGPKYLTFFFCELPLQSNHHPGWHMFNAFSQGWSSNKSPWNIAHWVKNCWPRYFPNPPGSVKRANRWLYSVYSDFSKVCFFSTLPALFKKQNPGMSRSKQSWNYQIHGQSTALRSAK